MSENPIADYLNAPGSRASFHVGDGHQAIPVIPHAEPSEDDLAAILADRATLRVPASRPRFGVDAVGVPIEAPAGGIPFDSETGTLATPDTWPTPDAPKPERRSEHSSERAQPAPAARASSKD